MLLPNVSPALLIFAVCLREELCRAAVVLGWHQTIVEVFLFFPTLPCEGESRSHAVLRSSAPTPVVQTLRAASPLSAAIVEGLRCDCPHTGPHFVCARTRTCTQVLPTTFTGTLLGVR